jgi:transposase
MATRHALTDEQWAILQPLLPPEKRITAGRPSVSHRKVINAILWLCRTGSPWRDIPGEFGPWRTIATRFYRWQRDGTWHRIFWKLREIADAQGLLDWDTHCIDSTVIRAHQHAAGGKKGLLARLDAAEVALERRCICELMVVAIPSPSRSRAAKRTTRRNS